jgi:hypothetical protein
LSAVLRTLRVGRVFPALFFFAVINIGCAAAFRPAKDSIHIESTPNGAEVQKNEKAAGVTPTDLDVERKKSTELTLNKPGYETYKGIPRRHINGAWITLDLVTCVFLLCIPLLVDALTGAWYDVDNYHASMKPGAPTPPATTGTGTAVVVGPPPSTTTTAPPTPVSPPPEMSESERKATARAGYLEGVKLQEAGACPDAIGRFEAAQKLYSAPTHLVHLAQCQAATGKLVEAAETYETLVRYPLNANSPEVFKTAQEDGKREVAALRPRIPTLRVSVTPPPQSLTGLVVKLNNGQLPNEVLGIARPVNPGHYKVTVYAAGYKETSGEVDVGEGSTKVLDLKLAK